MRAGLALSRKRAMLPTAASLGGVQWPPRSVGHGDGLLDVDELALLAVEVDDAA